MAADLLIVGASTRAATHSAVAAGYDVRAADLFADLDLVAVAPCQRISEYPSGLLAWRKQLPDVPLMYTGAIENYPDLISELSRYGPLAGNSAASCRRVRDPWELRNLLQTVGLPCADLSQQPEREFDPAWLRKPLASAGGFHLRRGDPGNAPREPGPHIYQEFINGLDVAASYVASPAGTQLLGVTQSLIGLPAFGGGGFVYTGSLLRDCQASERDLWQQLGEAIANEFGFAGVFGIDAKLDAQGRLIPLECNPRYTASMEVVERSYEISIVRIHWEACLRGSAPASLPQRPVRFAGKAILYAERPTQIPRIPWATSIHTDVPHPDSHIAPGHPIVTVHAEATEPTALLPLLERRARDTYALLESGGDSPVKP